MEFDRERRKVLIASGSDKGIEYLTGQLSGGRYDTSYPVASAAEARRRLDSVAYDILIVNTPLKDEFGADFASGEAENSNIGVVLIVKNEIYDQIAYKTEDSPPTCMERFPVEVFINNQRCKQYHACYFHYGEKGFFCTFGLWIYSPCQEETDYHKDSKPGMGKTAFDAAAIK